ncbi:hypothetical protein [cf. Phormidesmis sp. LEGE 11477]|uniref:hypothetical protein n=1 Tax=cf. Phormidesmis sp. LEGE 11477 TaxID=1828680 RepID=UPI00188155E8|nr:hypothetical protein [cf. Phormidesmis sp. LEGE 11477]MBE9061705.1 hypothetical protein [cf. Phormidesmis sp. LEGE 11477]
MKKMLNSLSALAASFRPLAIASICALFLLTSVAPALAIGGSSSSPSKGLEQLDTVQKESEKAISGDLSSNNDGKSVMKKSAQGLNGVQGRANKKDMYSPDDANATSVEEKVENALEEVTP